MATQCKSAFSWKLTIPIQNSMYMMSHGMSVQLRSSSGFQSRLLFQGINKKTIKDYTDIPYSAVCCGCCGAVTLASLLLQNQQTNLCVVAVKQAAATAEEVTLSLHTLSQTGL